MKYIYFQWIRLLKNKIAAELRLKTEEKNVIELKENEQSNINFNYVKTSPDHRTAGNLAH